MRRRRWTALVLVPTGALVLSVVEPAASAMAGHTHHRVEPGTAAATANVLGISPAVSGLQLSATIGESTAAYQGTETQASSGTVDLGALGLVLATSQFCGQAELPESRQPHPITADSQNGESHTTHGTKGLGEESVAVDPKPESATATTTTIDQQLPGVVSVRGNSHVEVHYVDGLEQVATSKVTETISLLGGKVRLEGMSWTARRTSGVTTSRTTHFSFGRVVIAGTSLQAPDSAPEATIRALNTALAPAGVSFREPVRSENHDTGAVAIGPFTIRFSGSSVERTAIGPLGTGVVALENLLKAVGTPGDNCANIRELIDNLNNNTGTLAHVLLAIAEGAGALDLQFGGVAAAAQDPVTYANPFGPGGAPPVPGGVVAGVPPSAPPVATSPPPEPTATQLPPTALPPSVATASMHCVSTSPSRAHSCWHGVAVAAAAGALGVGVVLLVADVVLARRRRTNLRSVEASE